MSSPCLVVDAKTFGCKTVRGLDQEPTILILSNMRHFGGAERSIGALLPYFAKHARVRIYVENEQHLEHLKRLAIAKLEIVRLRPGNAPLAFIFKLAALTRDTFQLHPTLLLANGHKGALLLALLDRLLFWKQLRTAVYVRDFGYYTLPFILRGLRRVSYFAPTQAIFDFPKYRMWGLAGGRCKVIPNAVKPQPAELPPVGGTPFIGCAARITPWKGIDFLVRAFHRIAPEFPTTELRIYGEPINPEYQRSLLTLIRELKLDGQVRFHPFVSEMAPVYRSGLFFVVPSLSIEPGPESFCRIIIEAWSFRKPVIAFATGGPLYLIRDGKDGLLVPERDIAGLGEAMRTLLGDACLRGKMGLAGYERIGSEFDPDKVAARLFDCLLGSENPDHPPREQAVPV